MSSDRLAGLMLAAATVAGCTSRSILVETVYCLLKKRFGQAMGVTKTCERRSATAGS